MSDEHREEDSSQSDQFNNNDQPQNPGNKPPFRGPMMNNMAGGFDPSVMKMGMMNPVQYQHFQQMMMMQQFQRQQQMQRHMSSAAAMAAAANNTSNIPPETQKPPTGYVCFKCGQPGHWIYYCPNVPKGQFVQRSGMNNRNQSMNQNASSFDGQNQKPQELTCMVCEKLMTEAVLVPCCGKSFCKECITSTLEKTNHCPFCNQENVSIDQLIPNRTLRGAIEAHVEEENRKEPEPMETVTQEQPHEDANEASSDKPEETSTATEPTKGNAHVKTSEEKKMPMRKPHLGGMSFNQGDSNMMMGAPDMFGGMPPDMNWMNMARPPFMNNRFPGFATPDMNWMRNNNNSSGGNDMDSDMPSRPPPPFMNPGFPGSFNPADVPAFPGMPPPQDLFGFGGMPFGNTRGGFNPMRGRGRGRGFYHGNNMMHQGRRRSDYNNNNYHQSNDGNADDQGTSKPPASTTDIPTGPRADRDKPSRYDTHRRSRSRDESSHSRRRDDSSRRHDESSSRRVDDSRRREDSHRRDDSRRRDEDSSRRRDDKYAKRSHHTDEEDDKRRESRRRSRSPKEDRHRHHSSSRNRHSSSRHRSSRYKSREREKTRDKSRDRGDRDRDRDRDRGDRRRR